MISVWGKFYPITENYKALNAINALYVPTIKEGTRDWLQREYTFYDVLVMDFRNDAKARDLTDQYMFGPALLVNPVTEYKARSRSVYVPSRTTWYDATRSLTIGARTGSFAGMPSTRTFTVVLVSSGTPVGYAGSQAPGRTVNYQGTAVRVTLQ